MLYLINSKQLSPFLPNFNKISPAYLDYIVHKQPDRDIKLLRYDILLSQKN